MVSTAQILSKRKRVSKKNKKSWRKNTEIKDVEKFLEEKLREERTGGNPSEKSNQELFYIDKTDIFQNTKSKLASMKCHTDLQVDTRVAVVEGYNGPSKKKKKKKKNADQQDISISSLVADNKKKVSVYDIWSSSITTVSKDKKELDPCLPPPVIPPAIYKTSDTKLSAVEVPHPGSSYNPTFTDHQKLLQSALDVEVKREKEKAKATRDAAPPIKITEEDYIKEMSVGLNQNESESERETNEEDEEDGSMVTAEVTVRKTRVQRNKEKAEKSKTEELAAVKLTKQRLQQINRVKAIKKEIKAEERDLEAKTALRQVKNEEKELRPGKFGPGKFVDQQPDFVLPDEVSSSLRQLVAPANNLQDRLTSLQKRNLVEVRKKVEPHRKYKLKYVEKWRKKLPDEIDELVKMKRKKKRVKLCED